MKRYLDLFFRHRIRFSLPIIFAVVAAGAYGVKLPHTYTSTSTLFCDAALSDPSTLLEPTPVGDTTPCQDKAGILTELLTTQSFNNNVAKRVTHSNQVDALFADALAKTISVAVPGPNVLRVSAKSAEPSVAVATASAAVAEFSAEIDAVLQQRGEAQAKSDQSLYNTTGTELTQAQAALNAYLQTNPGATDTQATQLQNALALAQQAHTQAETSYNQAVLSEASGSDPTAFHVIDPPSAPVAGATKKQLILVGMGGLIGGLVVTILILVLVMATDRTVRDEKDLEPELDVVGTIPQFDDGVLSPKGRQRRKDEKNRAKQEAEQAKRNAEQAKKDAEQARKDAEQAKKDAELAKREADLAKRRAEKEAARTKKKDDQPQPAASAVTPAEPASRGKAEAAARGSRPGWAGVSRTSAPGEANGSDLAVSTSSAELTGSATDEAQVDEEAELAPAMVAAGEGADGAAPALVAAEASNGAVAGSGTESPEAPVTEVEVIEVEVAEVEVAEVEVAEVEVAEVAVTEVAVTEVAVTEVAVTEVAVTETLAPAAVVVAPVAAALPVAEGPGAAPEPPAKRPNILQPPVVLVEACRTALRHLELEKRRSGDHTSLLELSVNHAEGSIGLTSCLRGEGRSTVAGGMAAAIHQAYGAKVILVELDLERPSLARQLGLDPTPGVAEILRDGAPIEDCLHIPGDGSVRVVVAGDAQGKADALFVALRAGSFIDDLAARCDIVVADLPPVFAAGHASDLGELFDSVLMVVRTRGAPVSEIRRAIDDLGLPPPVILNGVETFIPRRLRALLAG